MSISEFDISRPTVFTFTRIWIVTLLLKFIWFEKFLDNIHLRFRNRHVMWHFDEVANRTKKIKLCLSTQINMDESFNTNLLCTVYYFVYTKMVHWAHFKQGCWNEINFTWYSTVFKRKTKFRSKIYFHFSF